MSDKDYVAYDPTPLPCGPTHTSWMSVELDSGAQVFVGLQPDHPHGGQALVHELRHTQPDTGERTVLVFSLSTEAAAALVVMYAAHGIIDVSDNDALEKANTILRTANEALRAELANTKARLAALALAASKLDTSQTCDPAHHEIVVMAIDAIDAAKDGEQPVRGSDGFEGRNDDEAD